MNPLCPSCRQPVEETDCYCRHCGRTLQPRMGFWYSHTGILVMALLAGPFALICVWMSRKISYSAKWIWTLAIGLISFYLFYSMYRTVVVMQSLFFSLPPSL